MAPDIIFSSAAQANCHRLGNRWRFQFAFIRFIVGRDRWPMYHTLAAFMLWASLESIPNLPGVGGALQDSIALGFAILFWVALTRSYREHRRDLNERDRIHSDRIEKMVMNLEAREERALKVLEANMTMKGQMIESSNELKLAVRELLDKRFCPFDGEAHPARQKQP